MSIVVNYNRSLARMYYKWKLPYKELRTWALLNRHTILSKRL